MTSKNKSSKFKQLARIKNRATKRFLILILVINPTATMKRCIKNINYIENAMDL